MKKLFLTGALALFGALSAQTGFKAGAHIGFPMGDLGKGYSFNVGADVAYLHPIAENLKIGGTTGYTYFTGKETSTTIMGQTFTVKNDGFGLIPVAGVIQYNFTPQVYVGTDLGMIFSTQQGGGSSFYYQPKVGYDFGPVDVYLGYKGWSESGYSASTLALGAGYKF